MKNDLIEKGYMPFKTKLIYFGLLLIAIVALPVLFFEIQRPWNELYGLIYKTNALLSGLVPSFDREELKRMNQFALDMIDNIYDPNSPEYPEDYYHNCAHFQAFNMLITERRLLTEDEVIEIFEESEPDCPELNYEELLEWFNFWSQELDKRPGLLDIFHKYKKILIDAHNYAVVSGFDVANIYVMLDKGDSETGFFKENIAFILESLEWWESSYPGEHYNLVETNTESWRASYDAELGGNLGFHYNPVFDPNRWYLPRFDQDEWGTWFTSWMAIENQMDNGKSVYNTFNVDFDAKKIKKLMISVGFVVIGIAFLLFSIIYFTSNRLGLLLTRPIDALIEGAESVMAKRYDHIIPTFGNDEFKRLIEVFNRMIQGIREMVNLKETLTKMLSEELAEKAAKAGLVLGGQKLNCTIMFTDFAGFSTITQEMKAEDVVYILNFYFSQLIPIVKKWGGFPDKYIGDAIVVIFGAPVRFDDHAKQAVNCAIEMQRKLRQINDERMREGKIVFEMRIGLNTGEVVVGAIGCDLKLEYTSIGETTNLANRMETKCEIGHVLMSESTYDKIKDIHFENITINKTPEKEVVKGYAEPVTTYSIYISNLKIEKDINSSPSLSFYTYKRVDR